MPVDFEALHKTIYRSEGQTVECVSDFLSEFTEKMREPPSRPKLIEQMVKVLQRGRRRTDGSGHATLNVDSKYFYGDRLSGKFQAGKTQPRVKNVENTLERVLKFVNHYNDGVERLVGAINSVKALKDANTPFLGHNQKQQFLRNWNRGELILKFAIEFITCQ